MKAYVIILESNEVHLDKVFLDKKKAYKYFEKLKKERNDLFEDCGDIVIFNNDDAYYIFEKEVGQ